MYFVWLRKVPLIHREITLSWFIVVVLARLLILSLSLLKVTSFDDVTLIIVLMQHVRYIPFLSFFCVG